MSNSTGGGHCRPESNSVPGPAHSMAATFKNLSMGPFHYKELLTSRRSTFTGEGSSLESRLEDHHHQAHCSCVSFLGWRAKQLLGVRGHGSTEVSASLSELTSGVEETPAASFFFRLLSYYGRLRESMRETNVNVYDLFAGNQILCFLTAPPIIPKKTRRRLATEPTSSFSRSTNDATPRAKMNGGRVQSDNSVPYSRGFDSNADHRLVVRR